ncbi:hypothetical protein HK096_008315, partial [Nowakowskiella sp. JEL0078]
IPQVFYLLHPRLFFPNKNGYTIIADTRSPAASRPSLRFKLRIVSDSDRKKSETVNVQSLQNPLISQIQQTQPSQFDIQITKPILYEFGVKVKEASDACISMQLTFAYPSVFLKLQVFDNNIEITSVKGRGVVTIHSLILIGGDFEPPPLSAKLSKEKEKEITKSTVNLFAVPKHKYIIQATHEPHEQLELELSKLKLATLQSNPSNPPPIATTTSVPEPNRPQSRGPKATSSAKRKKPGPLSAGSSNEKTILDKNDEKSNEPGWRLRIYTTEIAPLIMFKDTEKEDRLKAIKDSWEIAQPGRAVRARENREAYIKMCESLVTKPMSWKLGKVEVRPWSIFGRDIDPHALDWGLMKYCEGLTFSDSLTDFGNENMPKVLNAEEISARNLVRDKMQMEHDLFHGIVKKVRSQDRDYRVSCKAIFGEHLDEKFKEVEKIREEDMLRRELYRQKILKDIEEATLKKLAAEAVRAVELAAEMG